MAGDKDKKNGLPQPEYDRDMESSNEKIPYPKSVFFIVTNEFCERFSYYGMKAVLTLYLNNMLKFSEDTSTVIYHVFSMACYFTPLLGAMIADSLLGKFKTIFYLSIVYVAGNVILALAATPPIKLPDIPFSMLGLALIALGTGGIKPCVAAFGGDQFVLPQQAAQLATFFSFFYMSINSGSLISTAITPIMRADVQCFDQDTCYSLAFSVPAALMIVSLLVFLAGKSLYRETKPTGNVVLKVVKCIAHAIGSRKRNRGHWLDNADDKFEPRFIEDVKIVLRVLLLYLPLPVFWALFDQQGSRWTLQATRMSGAVSGGFTIKPDQIQVLNPILILLFIPLFDYAVYPVLAKFNILKKPLQRLTAGGVLAGVAFIISGVVEMQLEKTYPNKLSLDEANLNFVNTLPCEITLDYNGNAITIPSRGNGIFEKVEAKTYQLLPYNDPKPPAKDGMEPIYMNYLINANCSAYELADDKHLFFTAKKGKTELEEQKDTEEAKKGGGFSYVVTAKDKKISLAYWDKSDDREKPKEGNPKIRFLLSASYLDKASHENLYAYIEEVSDKDDKNTYEFMLTKSNNTNHADSTTSINHGYNSATKSVEPKEYMLHLVVGGSDQNSTKTIDLEKFKVKLGGSYLISITNEEKGVDGNDKYNVAFTEITKHSTLHMAWLLPQYIVITAGEIMFSITGLEFSYSQAPVSMKSVMQSAWLLTVAFGNLIVIIIAAIKFFDEQSKEFFLFAGLMFVDMLIFAFMAWRYVPAQLEDPSKKKDEDK